MFDVPDLFTQARALAKTFEGRPDLAGLAESSSVRYLHMREHVAGLIATMESAESEAQYDTFARELQKVEALLAEALVEYAATLSALGGDQAGRLGELVESAVVQSVAPRPPAPPLS